MASVKSVSDIFLTSSDFSAGAFIAGLPSPSGPWQAEHLLLYRVAPSSAAQDKLGIRMNNATAIVRINTASFVTCMMASSLKVSRDEIKLAAFPLVSQRC